MSLSFAPAEANQCDWSHKVVLSIGATVTVKGAHLRLCQSRMRRERAYPRGSHEVMFDAQEKWFACFTRGIRDNMTSAVATIFVGRDRVYNLPVPASVQPLPGGSRGPHARIGLAEGIGRGSGLPGARGWCRGSW